MIFDSHDITLLRLCGLCRYLPCDLRNRYDNPVFYKNVAGNLLTHGLIKLMPDQRSIKLTRMGKKVLADIGYEYPEDARQKSSGNIYERRLISAHVNILLYCAGIDVFADTIYQLRDDTAIYIPSLTIRANIKSKAFAGTRFLGILRIADTVYIPYHISRETEGIIPGYEGTMIKNQTANLADIKQQKILLVGETLEILLNELSDNKIKKFQKGLLPCSMALKEMNFNICLTTFTRGGILQLMIILQDGYRKRIVDAIAEGFRFGRSIPKDYTLCDGIYEKFTAIVAVEMDITRIEAALRESAAMNKAANIICLSDQYKPLEKHLNTLAHVNVHKLYELKREHIQRIFPEIRLLPEDLQPYRTEKGGLVKVNEMGETIYH